MQPAKYLVSKNGMLYSEKDEVVEHDVLPNMSRMPRNIQPD
jgi:hypothetical protein